MDEVILSGSIEGAIKTHLESEFSTRSETATVHRKNAPDRPPNTRFVVIKRTGGVLKNLVVDSAQMEFSCHAATEEAAETLAYLTRGIVNALPGEVISSISVVRTQEVGGPINLPNPTSHSPRYRFITQVDFRMASE